MNHSPPQWRIALLLGVASVLATAALFPYLLALKPGALAMASATMRIPPAVVVVAQSLQSGVICFLLAWAGLKLGASLGLGAPWLAAAMYGRPRPSSSAWLGAILLGFAVGVLLIALITLFGVPIETGETAPTAPLWKGLLASPYGAIVEETICRVFLMSAAAWLLTRLRSGESKPWIMIAALVFAAFAFGAGHLPMASQLAPLTIGIVTRVIAYNAIGGLVFGWLYWKRGLEHAVLAHLCADLVLHVAAPAMT